MLGAKPCHADGVQLLRRPVADLRHQHRPAIPASREDARCEPWRYHMAHIRAVPYNFPRQVHGNSETRRANRQSVLRNRYPDVLAGLHRISMRCTASSKH